MSKVLSAERFSFLTQLGLLAIAIAIPTSKAVLSLSTAFLLVLLLVYQDFKSYYYRIKSNKILLSFMFFSLYYCLSLLWSKDIQAGLRDIISKLNLFVLPILIVSLPSLKKQTKELIFIFFVLTVLITSLLNFSFFTPEVNDFRSLSLFTSHIRFSLYVVFSIFYIVYAFLVHSSIKIIKVSAILWIVWLLYYTYYSQVMSGLFVLLGCFFVSIYYVLYKQNFNKSLYTFFALLVGVICFVGFQIKELKVASDSINISSLSNLPKYTKKGNLYTHDINANVFENGNPVYLYVCKEELQNAWIKRSHLPLSKVNQNNFSLEVVLLRYLTSKGLTKDEEGVMKLTSEDIRNIENGIASYLEVNNGFISRFNKIKYELQSLDDPNGHSFLQRIEYWKTSLVLIQKHLFFGTGIGDYKNAFQSEYTLQQSKLLPENRLESHNQFLAICVATGLVGFLLFSYFLIQFLVFTLRTKSYLGLIFVSLCILSFVPEDTLSTLTGMTFFAFFFGVFIQSESTNPYKELEVS